MEGTPARLCIGKMAARAFLRILALVGAVLTGKSLSTISNGIRKGYPLEITNRRGTVRVKMLISRDRRLSFDQAVGHCRTAAIVLPR